MDLGLCLWIAKFKLLRFGFLNAYRAWNFIASPLCFCFVYFRFWFLNLEIDSVKICISKFLSHGKCDFSKFCDGYWRSTEKKNLSDSQGVTKRLFRPPLLRKMPKNRVILFCNSRKKWHDFRQERPKNCPAFNAK